MRRLGALTFAAALGLAGAAAAQDAPRVVSTFPPPDSVVPAGIGQIQVTYDRPMMPNSWSFATGGERAFPAVDGGPVQSDDGKSFSLAVKLEAHTTYVIWLNTDRYQKFKDEQGHAATPYRLTFTTSE
ncbi:Ig-like domain-containing protein [Phenylobacterium sp.]|uniref:Ig-like domain-containing protein n=1 Tax=Phenylobacterium sp. TaxID=1871053 RepID=UPI002DED89E1|nr:Ig-like domain-containing protein [Phenylobacterium sp.]